MRKLKGENLVELDKLSEKIKMKLATAHYPQGNRGTGQDAPKQPGIEQY
jgi:hypothetical protein